MTKLAVKKMIKKAKETALEKAMAAAEKAGKPTTTGIAAGAGLGTILAAIGALKRNGENPENVSVLSNPLLLGTLGAAGGYLAGNAFEKARPKKDKKELSTSALVSLLGGTGLFGSLLAKQDAKALVENKRDELRGVVRALRRKHTLNINTVDGKTVYELLSRNGNPVPTKDILDLENSLKGLSKAHRQAGNIRAAEIEAMYKRPEKLGYRFLERLRNSPYSPIRWAKSLNPFKGEVLRSGSAISSLLPAAEQAEIRSMTGLKGRKLLAQQFRNIFRKNKVGAGVGLAALLAGGGKALYDYMSD